MMKDGGARGPQVWAKQPVELYNLLVCSLEYIRSLESLQVDGPGRTDSTAIEYLRREDLKTHCPSRALHFSVR